MSTLASVGDNVVDIYSAIGSMFPGGNALNVAVAARRSGLETAYVGAVGDDGPGETIRAALAAEGVATDRLRVCEGPTAYCLIELVAGDRKFVGADLGVSRFRLDEADLRYLSGFACIHTGDCSGTEDQLAELASVARLSFDFSNRPVEYYEPLLDKVWLACFSGDRSDGGSSEELAARVLDAGPEVVLVTEGPRGAFLSTVAGERVRVPAIVTVPVDTLGAGDAAIGAVVAGLLRGDDLETILTSAMALASRACGHYGAFGHGAPVDS